MHPTSDGVRVIPASPVLVKLIVIRCVSVIREDSSVGHKILILCIIALLALLHLSSLL